MAYKFQIGDALLGGALRQKGTITGEGTVSASSDFVIGAAAINETELEYLDSAAPGVAAARKVVVADGSRNIGNLVGVSGSAGVFSTSVSGAAVQVPKDGLAIAGANVTTTAAELNFNDGATAGNAVANKTLVVDGSRDLNGAAGSRINDLTLDGTLSASAITIDQVTADRFVGGIFTGTDFDVASAGNVTLFDTVGANNLTLGAGTSTVVIPGNLTVQGTRTLLDTTNLAIEDNMIELNRGNGAGGTRASNANAGIFITGSVADRDISLLGASDGGRLKVSGSAGVGAGFDIVAGGDYAIDGTSVLTSTTLGSAVVNSSLTSVGALAGGSIASGFTQIAVSGVVAINTLDIDGGVLLRLLHLLTVTLSLLMMVPVVLTRKLQCHKLLITSVLLVRKRLVTI